MKHRSHARFPFVFHAFGYKVLVCCAFLAPALVFAGKSIDVPSGKFKTITEAMASVGSGDTIWVDPGVYRENVVVYPGVALKSRSIYKAIIDGNQHGTVVTLGKKASVSGFDIRNGTIGVFSKSVGNAVSHCRIMYNWQTGVMCVRNLAKIEDNIIAFNGASGIQLYHVSATSGLINHNTIAFNANHGIAIGENSPVLIQNNIIAFNERFGVVLQGKSKDLRIVSNDIYGNIIGSPPLPPENFSFDPGFSAPRAKMDFTATSKSAANRKGADNEVLGARFN
jgi:nitrous oxidase accessory protein NosD